MRTRIRQNERTDYMRVLGAVGCRTTNILPDSLGLWPNEYVCRILSRILTISAMRSDIIAHDTRLMTNIHNILMGKSCTDDSCVIHDVFDGNVIDSLTMTEIYDIVDNGTFPYFLYFPASTINLKHLGATDTMIGTLSMQSSNLSPLMISMSGNGLDAIDIMYILRGYHDDDSLKYVNRLFEHSWMTAWTKNHTAILRHIDDGMMDKVNPRKPDDIIDEYHRRAANHENMESLMAWLGDSMYRDDIHEERFMVECLYNIGSIVHDLRRRNIDGSMIMSGMEHYPEWIDDIIDMPKEFISEKILIMAQ